MPLQEVLGITVGIVKGTYEIAVYIYRSENLYAEFKEIAQRISTDLTIVESVLNQLKNFAHRVTVHDEEFLTGNITLINSVVLNVQTILEEIRRDRNFIERLLMDKDGYRNRLNGYTTQLHDLCKIIQGNLTAIIKIEINRREFPDFRRTFSNRPEKVLSFYDFSIVKNTSDTILTIAAEQFHKTRCCSYMKADNKQFFISYQLRTWSASNPTPLVLKYRREEFAKKWIEKTSHDSGGSYSSSDLPSPTNSVPSQPNVPSPSPSPPPTAVALDQTRNKLDFSEFFMSSDRICGIALTQSSIYIATKYEITIVSLSNKEIIAQYGVEGSRPNTFDDISYIYIPPNDERNLYIVDRGQHGVHHYKIDDSGLRFEYVRQHIVIANVNQRYNLVSCVIYKGNLYVSDDANNCLHVFPLNGERQSFYLTGNFIMPFSPRSLCAHEKYLYVASCSPENPGIVVFNEDCQPIDWYRNQSLQEILAMDIDPNIRELYVLTTAKSENDERKTRPLVVSMDLPIRSEQP